MAAIPTSSLTFSDLIVKVAKEIGSADYGAGGNEVAQVPTDAHDLQIAKDVVNDAIRVILADAPPTGWRWTKPIASLVLWDTVPVNAGDTVSGGSYDAGNDETPLTSSLAVFEETMEQKTIVTTTTGALTIKTFVSSTVVQVEGDQSGVSAETFSITADGDYTLPRSFGGMHANYIEYAADTNNAQEIKFTHPSAIQHLRSDVSQTNDPERVAIRVRGDRRRWELMTWPTPSRDVTVEFPFDLHFDELTVLTEFPPIPFTFDELIKAACFYVKERDLDRQKDGPHQQYYDRVLQQAYFADSRTAPSRLGYFGNPEQPRITRDNFRDQRGRPTVTIENQD